MAKEQRYIEGVGRRKTATARVRITPSSKKTTIVVNQKPLEDYFKAEAHASDVQSVFATQDAGLGAYAVSAHVSGGGLSSQAEAIRLGIARALVKEEAARRSLLKRAGFLKRDPRAVERKKFGLRKARRRPQWSKR